MNALIPSLRLRTIVLAALFGFTTFFVSTTPTELRVPVPEALAPQPAKALACASGPSFSGHLTSSSASTALLARSATGNVFGYLSNVATAWSCTAWYRYDGLAWARTLDGAVGNFDWGNLINSTSVSCNWALGSTDYLKANGTTDCADSDDEYAMPIFLGYDGASTLLEAVYHNDVTPDEYGDFGFIHSDCESYYGAESMRWTQTWASADVGSRPGSNCDPRVFESTNTAQSVVVDDTPPVNGSISINGGANWTSSTSVTITPSAADNLAGVAEMRFSNDGSSWGGWVAYPSATSWTLSAGSGTKTVYAQFRDANGNATTGTGVSDTIGLDTSPATPTPPDVTCAAVASAVYQASINAPCFFRPAAATTINLTATATDPQSGIAHLRFETLTPTTGWTPTPVLPNLDTVTPYTQALVFSASAGSSTLQVRSRNGAGLEDISARTVTLTADPLGPTTTFLSPASGTAIQPSDAVTVQWTESDGLGAGVLSRSLQRQTASWNGTACGTFANDPAFTATSATSAVNDTGLLVNTCYRYVQTLTDQVGNDLATTSGVIVRETLGNLGIQGQHTVESWDLGAGDSLAVNLANGNLLVSHPIASLPIRGSAVDLGLMYNRHDPADVGMGPGWRLDVLRRLTVLPNNDVTLVAADGARYTFTNPQGATVKTYTRPAALYATLVRDTGPAIDRFTLTYRDQSTDIFDELAAGTGFLVREQDRHGNGVDLGHIGTELRTITDTVPTPDRVIDLTWSAGKLTQVADWAYQNGAGEVQTTNTGTRRTTRFFYDGSGRLAGWADPLATSGSCPTGGSHLTCLDYAAGLAITKTQTYTTVSSGVLATATRPVTTTVTFAGSDVALVKHAAEATGTAITRPSVTEVQVVRKGSGTSQDTTTKYTRSSANDPYARITSIKRWTGSIWFDTTTTFDTNHPVEPAAVTEDAGGSLARTTSFTYVSGSMGIVNRIIEPRTASDDRWTDHTYNTSNDLISQTVSLEGTSPVVTTFTYAANSCSPNAALLLQCATTANVVDGIKGGTSGHLEDVTTDFTYDADGQRLTQTRHVYEAGNAIAKDDRIDVWTYDDRGNMTSAIVNHADGAVTGGTDVTPSATTQARTDLTTTYGYDTAGHQVSAADPRRLIYDVADTPGADDYLATTVYDALGQAVSSRLPTTPAGATCTPDPGCRTSTTTYDELGGVRFATDPDGTVSAIIRDAAGRTLATYEDVDGAGGTAARQTNLLTIDPQGRTLTAKDDRQLDDGTLGETTITYDALGRATSTVQAAGGTAGDESTTATVYDALDRVTQQTTGTQSAAAQTTWTRYDLGGRVTAVDDEFTCTTTTYDHRDLPVTIVEGLTAGNPCSGTPTRTISLTYDALGRLLDRVTGSTTLESNTYDSAGTVRRTWASEGTKQRVSETAPNLLDEPLESLRYLQDGVTLSERTWSRTTRDGAGNETDRCTWTAAPTEWCHAASDTAWAAPAPISRSSTTYDARNQRTRLFVPGKGETTYDPAADYQVDKNYVTTKLDGSNQVIAEHVTDHSYDGRDRLTGISQSGCVVTADTHTCTSSPVVTGTTTYLYDDGGNRTQVIEDNGSGAITRYYCYDARNQLTAVSATAADCTTPIETYTYDAAGNRTSAPGRTFTYDAQGQLASCTPTCGTPAFDPEGRLTGITTASGAWTYQYDAEGRLVTACKATSCAGTPDKVAFTYDGDGHRIRIVETPASGTPITTDVAYEGDTVVRETATTGASVVTRTFTTDEAGAIIKVTVATSPSAGSDDGTYLITYNGHGDAIGLAEINPTDGSLIPAATYTYSTWGTPTVSPQSGYGNLGFRYLYVGRFDVQWDDFAGAGLLYMHARHYSPEFGRFLTPDPSALETNLYGYTDNSPITRIDSSGEVWTGALNPQERKYCDAWQNKNNCAINLMLGQLSAETAIRKYGLLSSVTEGKGDACRHCVWQASLTLGLGRTVAATFGSLHEGYGPNERRHWTQPGDFATRMDLFNNYKARNVGDYARSHGLKWDWIVRKCIALIEAQTLMYRNSGGGR